MFETARRKIAARMLRLSPVRTVRRFVRHQDGSAAVEFGFVAVPFLALLFAILETALVFFASQTLEAAAADAARLIMTGQAQTTAYKSGPVPYSANDFKNAVCDHLAGGLFTCADLTVDVKTYKTDFSSVNITPPVTSGNFDATKTGYAPDGPGCVVSVTLYYQWKIYLSLLDNTLSNLNGGSRLLVATAVFRNEPYGPAAC